MATAGPQINLELLPTEGKTDEIRQILRLKPALLFFDAQPALP